MARTVFSLVGRITMEGLGGVAKGLGEAEGHAVKFNKQIQKVGREVGKAGKAITKSISGPLAVLGGVVTGLSYKTGQYADKLLDMREATDLSTDTLQELRHVSTDAGVSFEGLTGAVQRLNRRLAQNDEESGAVYDTISKLGVEIRDTTTGAIRSMNDLFPEVLRSLQGMENRTERNRIAQRLFGTVLKDLAPVLGMTNEHFEALRENAHQSGLVMSEDALNAANDFRVEVDKLREQFGAAGREIAMSFVPILSGTVVPLIKNQLIPLFTSFADKIKGVADWFGSLSPAMQETIVKTGAFLAILGPAMLAVSKAILMYKGLTTAVIATKKAVMGLTVAFAANPFGLALISVAALGTALYTVKRQMDGIKKDTDKKTWGELKEGTREFNDELEKTRGWYVKLRDQIQKAYKETNDVAWIEKQYGEDVRRRVQHAKELGATQAGLTGNMLEQIQALDEFYNVNQRANKSQEETNKKKTKARQLTDEEVAALQKLREERSKIDAENQNRLDRLLLSRTEQLNEEERSEIEQAKRVGADVQKIRDYYALRREEIEDEHRKKAREKELKLIEEREALEQRWNDYLFFQSANRSQIIDREHKNAIAEAKKLGADTVAIEKYYSNLRESIVKQEAEEKQNYLISAVQRWASEVGNILSQVGSIFSQYNSNRMMEIDNWLKTQLDANETSYLNEEEKAKRKEQLEQEADQKRKALQLQNAKREKKLGIFSAIISTAQAVASALKTAPPMGLLLAGLYGALGAAQVAMIASQPLPQLNTGGLINEDVKAQLHANEAVIPLKDNVLAGIGQQIHDATNRSGSSVTNNSRAQHTHLHIGTFIGDERGLKELERRMRPIRVAEDKRTGAV